MPVRHTWRSSGWTSGRPLATRGSHLPLIFSAPKARLSKNLHLFSIPPEPRDGTLLCKQLAGARDTGTHELSLLCSHPEPMGTCLPRSAPSQGPASPPSAHLSPVYVPQARGTDSRRPLRAGVVAWGPPALSPDTPRLASVCSACLSPTAHAFPLLSFPSLPYPHFRKFPRVLRKSLLSVCSTCATQKRAGTNTVVPRRVINSAE